MEHSIAFESYGVVARIDCNAPDMLPRIKSRISEALVGNLTFIDDPARQPDCNFEVKQIGAVYEMFENGEGIRVLFDETVVLVHLSSMVRLNIAERCKTRVFVHAGVFGVKGKLVVIPGVSYSGKTTLVSEFARLGVEYFSDEYAVLDEEGYVHPFARKLSVRGADGIAMDVAAESLGATIGSSRRQIGLVLATAFEPGAEHSLETLSTGNGVIELIAHTVPIRMNTNFSLKVLNKALEHAIILKGKRGEGREFAEYILSYINNDLQWSNSAAT